MSELFEQELAAMSVRSSAEQHTALCDVTAPSLRRQAALWCFVKSDVLEDEKVQALVQCLDDGDMGVQRVAAALSSCFRQGQVIARLHRVAQERSPNTPYALRALAELGDESIVPLCAQLLGRHIEGEIASAATVLGILGSIEARDVLREAFQHELRRDHKVIVGISLIRCGDYLPLSYLEQELLSSTGAWRALIIGALVAAGSVKGLRALKEFLLAGPEQQRLVMAYSLRSFRIPVPEGQDWIGWVNDRLEEKGLSTNGI